MEEMLEQHDAARGVRARMKWACRMKCDAAVRRTRLSGRSSSGLTGDVQGGDAAAREVYSRALPNRGRSVPSFPELCQI